MSSSTARKLILKPDIRLEHGDMMEVLPALYDAGWAFDSVVTDPPYGLNFMNKHWDQEIAFQPETWRQVGSVLRPGAYLLAFGGTKGFHRMMVAIEDAGFEIRDTVFWMYGQGMPKSHNISKAIDKAAGAVRKVTGTLYSQKRMIPGATQNKQGWEKNSGVDYVREVTEAATDAAKQWEGWGTALKPAIEPIVLARWPMSEKTVEANVRKHGTGALNIEACRVLVDEGDVNQRLKPSPIYKGNSMFGLGGRGINLQKEGRWPANVITDGSDEVVRAFPEGRSAGEYNRKAKKGGTPFSSDQYGGDGVVTATYADKGSAARFFYTAKASAKDRDGSKHPTVKPIALLEYLIKLITPPGGMILDPFAGSGTMAVAASNLAFDAMLIEREDEYATDIRRRITKIKG